MLEVRDDTKRYGALTAVSHVSFTVSPGEVLGYLGPNGSGQSTTVRMLAGLMPPTRGHILLDGAPALLRLARTAVLLFGAVLAATLVSYPIACRRLMATGAEGRAEAGGSGWSTRGARGLTLATGRHHHVRAVSQFFLTSLGRVDRLRFVLAVGFGVAIAWGVPSWLSLRSGLPETPRTELLSLSLSTMVFLLVALRVAAALPSDLGAAWVFEISALDRPRVRAAVERTLFALGVVPAVIVFATLYWWLWGVQIAVSHAAISVAVGILLTEILLWGFDVVPCSRRWNPESLNLGRWWPFYAAIFILFTVEIPSLELLLLGHPIASGLFASSVLALALLVRRRSSLQPPTSEDDTSAVCVPSILSLD